MNQLTVFSQDGCGTCVATKAALTAKGIRFTEVDITADDAARAALALEGFTVLPVVKTQSESWSGFRIDKINELAESLPR